MFQMIEYHHLILTHRLWIKFTSKILPKMNEHWSNSSRHLIFQKTLLFGICVYHRFLA